MPCGSRSSSRRDGWRRVGFVALGAAACHLADLAWLSNHAGSFCRPALLHPGESEPLGPEAFDYDLVAGCQLPKPWVLSKRGRRQLWSDLGVNVRAEGHCTESQRWVFVPQSLSAYRPLGGEEEAALRDMRGACIGAERNPGVRLEPGFVSEAEEQELAHELQTLAAVAGFPYSSRDSNGDDEEGEHYEEEEEDPDEEADSWDLVRMTGRDEDQPAGSMAPWGYGVHFNRSCLPPALSAVVARIEGLRGYALGPIRDITVNIRRSVDYQMAPHIDPPTDGPNTFVLSLLSGAIVTFSPVQALHANALRASNENMYCQQSFTDDDIDCRVPQRALYHMAGSARYSWAHSIRPPLQRISWERGIEAFERWGTLDTVLPRRDERIAVILAFADPWDAQYDQSGENSPSGSG